MLIFDYERLQCKCWSNILLLPFAVNMLDSSNGVLYIPSFFCIPLPSFLIMLFLFFFIPSSATPISQSLFKKKQKNISLPLSFL